MSDGVHVIDEAVSSLHVDDTLQIVINLPLETGRTRRNLIRLSVDGRDYYFDRNDGIYDGGGQKMVAGVK